MLLVPAPKGNAMEMTKVNAADHLGLVGYIVNKYQNCGTPYDELFSAGSFGLVKAANSFDVSKGFKFATYATRCIENEILMLLRKAKKSPQCVTLHRYNDEQEKDFDFEIAYFEKYEQIDELLTLKEAIAQLSERDKKLIFMRYFQGKTQAEVGKAIGVEQSYVSRLERQALKKLKEYMEQ